MLIPFNFGHFQPGEGEDEKEEGEKNLALAWRSGQTSFLIRGGRALSQ